MSTTLPLSMAMSMPLYPPICLLRRPQHRPRQTPPRHGGNHPDNQRQRVRGPPGTMSLPIGLTGPLNTNRIRRTHRLHVKVRQPEIQTASKPFTRSSRTETRRTSTSFSTIHIQSSLKTAIYTESSGFFVAMHATCISLPRRANEPPSTGH